MTQKICKKCGRRIIDKEGAGLCYRCKQVEEYKVTFRRGREARASNLRPCHDCGKMIVDYRCSACWEKWKKKYGLPIDS